MPRKSAGSIRRQRTPVESATAQVSGWVEQQHLPEGTFLVRAIAGSAAVKVYRCPGCQHEVKVAVAHVVVWPAYGEVSERRHWHSACWQRRATRGGPGRLPWSGM